MLDELELLSRNHGTASVSQALQILEQITAQLGRNISENTRERMFVPDHNGVLKRVHDIYSDDLNRLEDTLRLEFGTPAHPKLSKSLAFAIPLRFLSSLNLGEEDDDDVDDMDMGEDLCIRIAGVLKDHDIRYALNEFMANAADAGASRFSVLLDTNSFESTTVISPGMAKFQQGPSLILHNDAIFTDKDFYGLRKIGQGGKLADFDTIGRFGLGALSLFHFTEVCPLDFKGTNTLTCTS